MGRLCRAEFLTWDDFATVQHNPRFVPPITPQKIGRFWPPALSEAGARAAEGEHLTGRAFRPGQRVRINHVYGLYIPLTYSVWGLIAAIAQTRTAAGTIELNPWIFHTVNVVLH